MKEEITVMSEKGQVVIPKAVREQLHLKPKSKFLVMGYEDTIMLKKLRIPDLKSEWEGIKKIIAERNKKYGKLSEKDIQKEIEAYRKEKTKN